MMHKAGSDAVHSVLVSFAAVFWDVAQRSPKKTAAKETNSVLTLPYALHVLSRRSKNHKPKLSYSLLSFPVSISP